MKFNISDFREGDEVDIIPGLVKSRAVVVAIISASTLYVKEIKGNFSEYISHGWVLKHHPKNTVEPAKPPVQMSLDF